MDNIRWIFFDLGGTLLDESNAFFVRFAKYAETPRCKELGLTVERLHQETIAASIRYEPQFKEVERRYSLCPKIEYEPQHEKLYPSTIEVLTKLKTKYHLGIIANQVKGVKDRLKAFGIYDFFEVIIGSNDVGLHKPDPEIFRLAIKEANTTFNKSLMVGDRLDNDIYPTKKLGMKTIWVKQSYGAFQTPKNIDYEATFVAKNLIDILSFLL